MGITGTNNRVSVCACVRAWWLEPNVGSTRFDHLPSRSFHPAFHVLRWNLYNFEELYLLAYRGLLYTYIFYIDLNRFYNFLNILQLLGFFFKIRKLLIFFPQLRNKANYHLLRSLPRRFKFLKRSFSDKDGLARFLETFFGEFFNKDTRITVNARYRVWDERQNWFRETHICLTSSEIRDIIHAYSI